MKNKTREIAEMLTLRHLMKQFPTGILSVVSDTFNLWDVLKSDGILSFLKEEILKRDGKIVIRPDSGDPVDIICGYRRSIDLGEISSIGWLKKGDQDGIHDYCMEEGTEYLVEELEQPPIKITKEQRKGVIELLWDLFGGTINEQGYKVLDPHIGAIYGDSITLERAEQITERLKAKGFASTNVVLGIGSYSYQYVTRDTHGFAMKATYVELKCNQCDGYGFTSEHAQHPHLDGDCLGECPVQVQCNNCEATGTIKREIFKDPITDNGGKKSAKGLLVVRKGKFNRIDEDYKLLDQVSWKVEGTGHLQIIFEDGKFSNITTLTEIRKRLNWL